MTVFAAVPIPSLARITLYVGQNSNKCNCFKGTFSNLR
jgi:hypothetical protein